MESIERTIFGRKLGVVMKTIMLVYICMILYTDVVHDSTNFCQ